jgi:hypothetical protein
VTFMSMVTKIMRVRMKTLVAGIRGIALAATLLAGVMLISCGPGGSAVDAPPPNLPSGVARPATATAVPLESSSAPVPVPMEVTRISSEPAAVMSATAQSVVSTTTAGGVTVLVLHSNDVRGYSLPCG